MFKKEANKEENQPKDKPNMKEVVYTMPADFYTKEKKSKKSLVFTLIAVASFLIIIIVGAAIVFNMQFKKAQETNVNEPVAVITNENKNTNENENLNINNNENINENVNENINENVNENVNENINIATPKEIPISLDSDNDGLTDEEERLFGTESQKPDSDLDGYLDGEEVIHLYSPKAGAQVLLEGTNLASIYVNPTYGYKILYPAAWVSASLDETANTEVMFTSDTGEFIEVIVQENTEGLPILDWYLKQVPGIDPRLIGSIISETGLKGVKSPDSLTVYLADDGLIYIITYNIGTKEVLNYRAVFEMMIRSFQIGVEKPGLPVESGEGTTEE